MVQIFIALFSTNPADYHPPHNIHSVHSHANHTICRLFQITNLMYNSFIFQQYVCYTTLLNMIRTACCSNHVEERSVTYILLKNKRIVH